MSAPIFIMFTDEEGLDIMINVDEIRGAYTQGGKNYIIDRSGEQIISEESPREIYNLIQAEIRKSM